MTADAALRCSLSSLTSLSPLCLMFGGSGTGEERGNDGLKHNNNVRFMPAIFYNHLIHLVLCENESSLVTCNQDNDEKGGGEEEEDISTHLLFTVSIIL